MLYSQNPLLEMILYGKNMYIYGFDLKSPSGKSDSGEEIFKKFKTFYFSYCRYI